MTARPESPSELSQPELLRLGGVAAAAVGLFLVSWGLLHVGFYTHHQVDDTPIYAQYGDAIERGEVPYRDFRLEYPPGAIPVFAVPALAAADDSFRAVFEGLMAACGAALVLLVAFAARQLRAGWGPAAFAALAPLALGSVVLTRFDLWPAALTAAAVAALLADRPRLGLGALGAGVAAKLYPVVLLPIALVYVDRRHGRRAALGAASVFFAVVLVAFVPFLVVAPGGLLASIGRQLSRPLQIESLGSAFLLVAHQLFGLGITMRSGHGSQNLVGTAPDVLAIVLSAVQVTALVALWIRFARGAAEPARLVRFCSAALCAFVALGKVLSPQFLVWLVPLVPLVRGLRGLHAAALLALALVLTQLWFPFRYWDLVRHFDATASWLVLARDLVLVGLLAALVRPRPGAPDHHAA